MKPPKCLNKLPKPMVSLAIQKRNHSMTQVKWIMMVIKALVLEDLEGVVLIPMISLRCSLVVEVWVALEEWAAWEGEWEGEAKSSLLGLAEDIYYSNSLIHIVLFIYFILGIHIGLLVYFILGIDIVLFIYFIFAFQLI
jgi:hypothetical protein